MIRAGVVAFLTLVYAETSSSQIACPTATLPAYAHNDYENRRPLMDALDLGYRGTEADVFLVNGTLRLGHDQRTAKKGGTLEAVYLEPLRSLVARCGALTRDGRPFLLAIEIKERSPQTYAALLEILKRYAPVFAGPSGTGAAVEVVLVGWHPPANTLRSNTDGMIRVQHRVVDPQGALPVPASEWTRLISLDYGKTMGRTWVTAKQKESWLAALREIKKAEPDKLLRVHNVPADGKIYAALLSAGVDLIGTRELRASRNLLCAAAKCDPR